MTTTMTTRFPSARNSMQDIDIQLLEDARDLGWKLYGKNEHFAITCNAVVKIQAFLRGCMSRAKTAEMIQELIDGILSYREIVAKYAAEDEARVQKQQLTTAPSEEVRVEVQEDTSRETKEEMEEYPVAAKRSSTADKPWLKREAGYVHPSTPLEFHLQEVLDTKEVRADTAKSWLKMKEAAGSTPNTTAESSDESDDSDSDSSDGSGSSTDSSGSDSSGDSSLSTKSPVGSRNTSFDSPVPKTERMQESLKDRLKFWESQSPQKSSPVRSPKEPHVIALLDALPKKISPPLAKSSLQTFATKVTPLPPPPPPVSEEISVKSSASLESAESFYNTPDGRKVTPISSRASTPVMGNSSFRSEDEDEKDDENENKAIDPSLKLLAEFEESNIVAEPGGRGYQRYKTNSNFRNKGRPWRDDTDVFDAF